MGGDGRGWGVIKLDPEAWLIRQFISWEDKPLAVYNTTRKKRGMGGGGGGGGEWGRGEGKGEE